MSDYGWGVIMALGYFALIGFAVWFTSSAVPLLALLLVSTPKAKA